MDRDAFIDICNKRLKLVRTEYGFTQEKMTSVLGISKKTLVEIEKGRSSLGWMGSIALCTIFENSEIIAGVFGGNPTDIIMTLAFDGNEPVYPQTMGGKVWWKTVRTANGYKIQQNIISQHYRILDGTDRRICSSFDYTEINNKFLEVSEHGDD